MSLSTDPDYLAQHGIRGSGGPMDGKYLTDGAVLYRVIPHEVDKKILGFYRLRGQPDSGLVYVWETRAAD